MRRPRMPKAPTRRIHFVKSFGAPTAIKIEPPKIDNDGLRAAYEWLVVDKVPALKLAFEWYAHNTPALLFGDPLDEARQKSYDRAGKSRAIGDSTDFPEEKFTAYGTAIKLYEKTWASRSLLTLEDAQTTITEVSDRVKNVQTVLTSLNTAFQGMVTFRMTFNAEREYLRGEILIPKVELERSVPLTPLKIVLTEVPTVAKALSIVEVDVETGKDADGMTITERQQQLDGEKFMTLLPTLLDNIASWAAGDRTLASKAIGKAIHTVKPAATFTKPKPVSTTMRFKANSTITIIDPSRVPYVGGKRARILALCLSMTGKTVAEFFTELKKITGSPCNMRKFALETLTQSGAITVS